MPADNFFTGDDLPHLDLRSLVVLVLPLPLLLLPLHPHEPEADHTALLAVLHILEADASLQLVDAGNAIAPPNR